MYFKIFDYFLLIGFLLLLNLGLHIIQQYDQFIIFLIVVNMADLKSLMPHIRRAAVANGIMILFFLSPSFLSFLAILVAISVVFLDNPSESLKCLFNCSEECSLTKCINESFDKFRNVTILEKLMFLVLFKLAIDFAWLIPTCVLIVLGTELFSAWELLKELGLIELAKKYIDLAHKSLDKVMGMIPKYKAI